VTARIVVNGGYQVGRYVRGYTPYTLQHHDSNNTDTIFTFLFECLKVSHLVTNHGFESISVTIGKCSTCLLQLISMSNLVNSTTL